MNLKIQKFSIFIVLFFTIKFNFYIKKMKNTTLFFLLTSLFFSCQTKTNVIDTEKVNPKEEIISTNEYMVLATNWYQQAAEMRAIYYQTYFFAKERLILNKKALKSTKKPAVVLDIDETILNNSPSQAKAIVTGKSFSKETWKVWTDLAIAEALPGAVDFTNFAKNQGVEVFYISNRDTSELQSTVKNLQEKGFPNAKAEYILLRTSTSDKTPRREQVSQNYEIILFVGDNLTDFSEMYAKRSDDMAFGLVDENKADFGTKFIVLPNPMYGEWEKAMYKNSYKWSENQKDSLRKSNLKIGY